MYIIQCHVKRWHSNRCSVPTIELIHYLQYPGDLLQIIDDADKNPIKWWWRQSNAPTRFTKIFRSVSLYMVICVFAFPVYWGYFCFISIFVLSIVVEIGMWWIKVMRSMMRYKSEYSHCLYNLTHSKYHSLSNMAANTMHHGFGRAIWFIRQNAWMTFNFSIIPRAVRR